MSAAYQTVFTFNTLKAHRTVSKKSAAVTEQRRQNLYVTCKVNINLG